MATHKHGTHKGPHHDKGMAGNHPTHKHHPSDHRGGHGMHETGANRSHPHGYPAHAHHDAHIGGTGKDHLKAAVEVLHEQHSTIDAHPHPQVSEQMCHGGGHTRERPAHVTPKPL